MWHRKVVYDAWMSINGFRIICICMPTIHEQHYNIRKEQIRLWLNVWRHIIALFCVLKKLMYEFHERKSDITLLLQLYQPSVKKMVIIIIVCEHRECLKVREKRGSCTRKLCANRVMTVRPEYLHHPYPLFNGKSLWKCTLCVIRLNYIL